MCTDSYQWHYDYPKIAWDTGFCFQNQKSIRQFNQSGIALLDIEKIINERDTATVEYHIQNIIGFNLDSEESRLLDPYFVKLFKLSQLAVEYLNYCKSYLDATLINTKVELEKTVQKNFKMTHEVNKSNEEIHRLKKKVKELKTNLQIYQKIHSNENPSEVIGGVRCPECNKMFINTDYLKSHISRRHPDKDLETIQINTTPVHTNYQIETDRLQMEIKELKEKLNNTFLQKENGDTNESQKTVVIEKEVPSNNYYKYIEELHHQFENMKVHLESEMQVIKAQKFEQGKYEQWMERFFSKLDERNEQELNKFKTEFLNSITVKEPAKKQVEEKEVQVEIKVLDISTNLNVTNVESNSTSIKDEMEKIVEEKTKQNVEKLGNQISKKMINNFEALEGKLETFINKFQQAEIQIKSQEIEKIEHKTEALERTIRNIGQAQPSKTKKAYKSKEITPRTYNIICEPEQYQSLETKNEHKSRELITFQNKNKICQPERNQSMEIEEKEHKSRELITLHQNKNIVYESSDDTETESSKDEDVQATQKNFRNLLNELKLKLNNNKLNSNQPLPSVPSETESDTESESNSRTEYPVSPKPKIATTSSHKILTDAEGVKSSHTGVSTLQNSSITSLDYAIQDNPGIMTELREDVKQIIDNRLKDLGVDPEWPGIPNKTYERLSEVVFHQRNIATKNNNMFMDLRKSIILNVEDKLKELKSESSKNLLTEKDSKSSKLKSMFVQMKDKAKSMIKSEKLTVPPLFYKMSYSDISNKESTNTIEETKSNSATKFENIVYETDSEDETESEEPVVYETYKSLSVIEEVSTEDKIDQKLITQSYDSILEIKQELKQQEQMYTSSLDESTTNEEENVKQNEENPKKNLSSESEIDDSKEEENIPKGVMKKSVNTSVKKKVLFKLNEETNNPKQTIVASTAQFLPQDDSSSVDSSILSFNKKAQGDTISTKAVINILSKNKQPQEDVSDWEISDIN